MDIVHLENLFLSVMLLVTLLLCYNNENYKNTHWFWLKTKTHMYMSDIVYKLSEQTFVF